MKKAISIFIFFTSFNAIAQNTVQEEKKKLLDKLHTVFADPWKLALVDDTISLPHDSLFLPSRYLLRASLLLPGTAGRAIIYFASNQPGDSVLANYFRNSIIKAFKDNAYLNTLEEGFEALNCNEQLIAFSFCSTETLCNKINNILTSHPALTMPTPEIKILDIKLEDKDEPPPPPPPPPPRRKNLKEKM